MRPRTGLCIASLLAISVINTTVAEPMPPRAGSAPARSGQTQQFGSGTITHRSDGSSSQTSPFGNGTLQRDTPGRKERP